MRKILVTFGGRAYDASIAVTIERAPRLGVDDVWVYDDKWLIDSGYVAVNKWLYDAEPKFGFGYCSWKAFVVASALDRLACGDVVFYVDADTYPLDKPVGQLFDACAAAGGVFLFEEQGCSNLHYTKADCMVAMGLPIAECTIAAGRFSLWQKGPFLARQMLAEWWAYSVNPRCMLWDRSVIVPDQPEFARHTTEQSVLTNLARKYGIPLHRTPDQNGSIGLYAADDALYAQVFEQKWCTGNRADLSGSRYRNIP